jgi:hypothetical protein
VHWVVISILTNPIYAEICMIQDVIIEASDKASGVIYLVSGNGVNLLGSYNDCENS